VRTRVGYAGGTTPSPTYHDIGDHAEVLQIDYDPLQMGYAELLDLFWASVDPTRSSPGTQYQPAVFAGSDDELMQATERGLAAAAARGGSLRTRVSLLDRFYRAEDYHQKYRLRQERPIVAELVDRYGSDQAMVDSTCAARINGLLSGHGERRRLRVMMPSLGLSASSARILESRVP